MKSLEFNARERRLDILVDFQRGASFPYPECGAPSKAHDTEEKTWRHLDFFQHAAYLTARVPRCKCETHGVKTVDVPWGRKGSGSTLMFEALIMVLAREMPVRAVARLMGEHDTRIWRVVKLHTDEARAKLDFSTVETICVDDKSYRRGHNYLSFFMDLDLRRVMFGMEGRNAATLGAFVEDLKAHGGKGRADVCCDMSPAFIAGIQEHLPKGQTFALSNLLRAEGS